MMFPSRATIMTLFVLVSSAASAAQTQTYTFDSVSQFDTGYPTSSVIGHLVNAATPTTVAVYDSYSVIGHCVPFLLTMTEKPGRYLLNVSVDPAATPTPTLISCGLQLKN